MNYFSGAIGKKILKWFWEIFDEMKKKDRELLLKFLSGDSRIVPGSRYSIYFANYDINNGFPTASTCSLSMDIHAYDNKETMKRNMLTAFRLCGEIDNDNEMNDYDSEGDSYDGEDYHEGQDDENHSDNDSDDVKSIKL